jgi:hypothetical protein
MNFEVIKLISSFIFHNLQVIRLLFYAFIQSVCIYKIDTLSHKTFSNKKFYTKMFLNFIQYYFRIILKKGLN